ncbi:MAG: hypothetical protein ACFFBD_02285 [Candidatus Hodarchaeota archaeon]
MKHKLHPVHEAQSCTQRTVRNELGVSFCIVYRVKILNCPEKCPFYQKGKPAIEQQTINLDCPHIGHDNGYFYCYEIGEFGDLDCTNCPLNV